MQLSWANHPTRKCLTQHCSGGCSGDVLRSHFVYHSPLLSHSHLTTKSTRPKASKGLACSSPCCREKLPKFASTASLREPRSTRAGDHHRLTHLVQHWRRSKPSTPTLPRWFGGSARCSRLTLERVRAGVSSRPMSLFKPSRERDQSAKPYGCNGRTPRRRPDSRPPAYNIRVFKKQGSGHRSRMRCLPSTSLSDSATSTPSLSQNAGTQSVCHSSTLSQTAGTRPQQPA